MASQSLARYESSFEVALPETNLVLQGYIRLLPFVLSHVNMPIFY